MWEESAMILLAYPLVPDARGYARRIIADSSYEDTASTALRGQNMIQWEHRYLLGTMVFTIAGDVVRDFDEEYEAWNWLEREGWGLVAIEPPDPVRPGACKYYFKRQRPPAIARPPITAAQPVVNYERRGR